MLTLKAPKQGFSCVLRDFVGFNLTNCANTTLGQLGLNNLLQGGLRMNDVCFHEAKPIKDRIYGRDLFLDTTNRK